MTIQYKEQVVRGTLSVPSNQSGVTQLKAKSTTVDQQKKKFIVNNEIHLQTNPNGGMYEITVNLTTGKGANYFAGVIKISQKQLIQSQGQILEFALAKCLDPQAFCEVRVNHASDTKTVSSRISMQNNPNEATKQQKFPDLQKISSATKTVKAQAKKQKQEYQLSRLKTQSYTDECHEKNQQKTSLLGVHSTMSPRVDNQNRNLKENTMRIKQLEMQIQTLMSSKIEQGPMQRIMREKKQIITSLQETVKNLQTQKSQLKDNLRRQQQSHEQQLAQLRTEIKKMSEEASDHSISKKITEKSKKIISLEADIRILQSKFDTLTQNYGQLQKSNDTRAIDFQRTLQYEKLSSSTTINKLNEKMRQLQVNKNQLQQNLKYLNQELRRSKHNINDLERENLALTQEIRKLSSELEKSKIHKQVSGQMESKQKSLEVESGQHKENHRRRKVSQESIGVEVHENGKQSEQLLQAQRTRNVELEEKCKNLTLKLLQFEKNVAVLKIQEERATRENESFRKEIDNYKIEGKSLTKDLRQSEERIMSLENKLEVEKQKYQLKEMKQQSLKQETQDSKSSANKLKQLYEEIQISHNSLVKQRDTISFECEKLKMKMKVLEEKLESVTLEGKEKQNNALDKLSKAEKEIINLKSKIHTMISNSQDLNDQVHAKQLENLKSQINLQNYQRQLRQTQEKLSGTTSYSKQKETEVYDLISSNKEKQLRIDHLRQDLTASKTKYAQLLAQFNTNHKTNQLLQTQTAKLKQQAQEKTTSINEMRKTEEELQQKLYTIEEQKAIIQQKLDLSIKQFQAYQKSVRDIVSLVPVVTKKDSPKQVDLQNSRASVIDELQKSIIYQLPITHFSCIDLDQNASLGEMKNMIVDYTQQTQKTIAAMADSARNLQFQNQRLSQQLADAADTAFRNQQSLFAKMKQFSQQIQQMGSKYTQQLKSFDENSKKLKRQLSKKEEQLENSRKDLQDFKRISQQEKKQLENTVKTKTKKYDQDVSQLKAEIQQLQTANDFLGLKNSSLTEQNADLAKDIENLKTTIEQSQSESLSSNEKKAKELNLLDEQIKSYRTEIDKMKTAKLEMIKKITELQSENNTLRDTAKRNSDVINQLQKNRKEQKAKTDQIAKQKDSKQKIVYEKQSKIISLNQQISFLQNQNTHLSQIVQERESKINELKESVRQVNLALKESQDRAKVNERKKDDVADRASMYERQLGQKDEYISKLEKKNLQQIEQHNKKKNQLLQSMQDENQKAHRIIGEKNLQIIGAQQKIKQAEDQSKKNRQRNAELQEMIYAERHKILQLEQVNETLVGRKEQLEAREEELEAMYCDLTEETKEKQEKLFGLSSKIHELQMRIKDREKEYFQATEQNNAKWQIKLKRMAEQHNKIGNFQMGKNQDGLPTPKNHLLESSELRRVQPERDQDSSPMKIIGPDDKSVEKHPLSVMQRSRRHEQVMKDVSHQYGGSRHLKYLQYEDSHGAHINSASSRNIPSRKEVKKYEPFYRKNQRYP